MIPYTYLARLMHANKKRVTRSASKYNDVERANGKHKSIACTFDNLVKLKKTYH